MSKLSAQVARDAEALLNVTLKLETLRRSRAKGENRNELDRRVDLCAGLVR
jgi:hypothetical protein